MIRKRQTEDSEALMAIWLETNKIAHPFIEEAFWLENYEAVKYAILEAEVWLDEAEGIQGFIGLIGDYVAGLFVKDTAQGEGRGKALLQQAQALHSKLSLEVYVKNTKAIAFYEKNGFKIHREKTNEATGEMEYEMSWQA